MCVCVCVLLLLLCVLYVVMVLPSRVLDDRILGYLMMVYRSIDLLR